MPPDRALVVMPAADSWRRALVPSAWLVLEELAVGASQDGELSTNVRQLGAGLGLSKDTAARALRRLIAVDLERRLVPNESRPPASTARSPRPTRPAASTSSTEQLDLFDSRS
jgi:hypothetical protein